MSKARAFGWWFLVLLVIAASTFGAFFWFGLVVDHPNVALVVTAHSKPPFDLLDIADLLSMFILGAIWVIPVAWVVGLAIRARTAVALLWGFAISLMLTGVFVWFRAQPYSRAFVIVAEAVAIVGIVLLASRKLPAGRIAIVEAASFVFLFIPSLIVLASVQKQPPTAQKVWSVALQIGNGQESGDETEINNGSRVAFAGNRIVAVSSKVSGYDGAGSTLRYSVVSLDAHTGAIRNELEVSGHGGTPPFVFGTEDGKIALVQPGVIRVLNSDLYDTSARFAYTGEIDGISPDGSTLEWISKTGTILLDISTLKPGSTFPTISGSALITSIDTNEALYVDVSKGSSKRGPPAVSDTLIDANGQRVLFHSRCNPPAHFLTKDRVLVSGCGKVRVLDRYGKLLCETSYTTPGGLFAGVAQNGKRFALEFSDERGDPSVMLYEQFVIYDSATATPVASVLMDSLPERQSWSAFSPDGRYFAVGNPNKLTLYSVP